VSEEVEEVEEGEGDVEENEAEEENEAGEDEAVDLVVLVEKTTTMKKIKKAGNPVSSEVLAINARKRGTLLRIAQHLGPQ